MYFSWCDWVCAFAYRFIYLDADLVCSDFVLIKFDGNECERTISKAMSTTAMHRGTCIILYDALHSTGYTFIVYHSALGIVYKYIVVAHVMRTIWLFSSFVSTVFRFASFCGCCWFGFCLFRLLLLFFGSD